MCAQKAAIDGVELQRRIVSEIPDAVFVIDVEQHVVYWNGPAASLFNLPTETVLGRPLSECCPMLYGALSARPQIPVALATHGKWHGELTLQGAEGQEIWLDAAASVLRERRANAGVLWMLRDITRQKEFQTELQHCRDLLQLRDTPAPTASPPEELGSAETSAASTALPPASKDVVLWAEDDDNDAVLMGRAWQKMKPNEHLIRVRDGAEVIKYLLGEGVYSDRNQYPLPRLLLLDLKMPRASGLDVIYWLQQQQTFRDLPVVILTSSAAAPDVHEAARLHVKGYLVKPSSVTEWLLKVQTVTAQCK